MENKIGIILTQWKRNHLENQLNCITNQNIKIHYIIVFQNENHVNITNILKKVLGAPRLNSKTSRISLIKYFAVPP